MRSYELDKILHINGTFPTKCQICEVSCPTGLMECAYSDFIWNWCYIYASVILSLEIVLFMYLGFGLIMSLKRETKMFTLRKMIFGTSCLYSFVRILRYALLLSGNPYKSVGMLLLDNFLYWIAYYFIFVPYSLLLVFWSNICSKSKKLDAISWIGKETRTRYILVISNFIIFVIIVLSAIATAFYQDVMLPVLNVLLGIVLLALCIAYLIEGYRVYKTIKKSYHSSNKESSMKTKLIQKFSMITLVSSFAFIVAFVVIIIAIVVPYFQKYIGCTIAETVYRLSEMVLVILITFPFRYSGSESIVVIKDKERKSSISASSSMEFSLFNSADLSSSNLLSSSATSSDSNK